MDTSRLFIFAAGLCGAAGVALSALASHQGGGNFGIAANFLLVHAPAFLATGLLGGTRLIRAGSTVLLVGLLLFSLDLLARHYLDSRLFPMAAPAGGLAMIAGWALIAVSAFFPSRAA